MKRYGHATTYFSKAVTDKFWIIDRALFAWSPYLTFDEAADIAIELERMAESKLEGNFTDGDAMNWLAQQLGPDRYAALCQIWIMDNQHNIAKLYKPEQLRTAWVHPLSMAEATAEEYAANPSAYIEIQTLKSEYK